MCKKKGLMLCLTRAVEQQMLLAYSANLYVAFACAASMLTVVSMACRLTPRLDLCHVCRDSPRIHEGWSSAHCGEPQDGEHKQAHTKVR